jgi:phosphohistidine phosphatase
MKTVLILRHGKSSWKHAGLDDHDRPLKKRGRRDGPRMGRLIRQKDLVPDRIVSSTAVRALSTAKLAAEACGYEGEITRSADLYLSGTEAYLDELRDLPVEVNRAMVVGHLPDVEELVFLMSGNTETMPTAALAWIDLAIDDWSELRGTRQGALQGIWRPRDLPDDP